MRRWIPHNTAAIGIALLASQHATAQSDSAARRARAVDISGTVFDSLHSRALAGAVVQLVRLPNGEASYTTRSDSNGAFRMGGVGAGRYLAGFLHPVLDSLNIEAPTAIVEVGNAAPPRIALAVPSARGIRRAVCGDSTLALDSVAMILGHVHGLDGAPLAGGLVVVARTDVVLARGGLERVPRQMTATADEQGWFAVCRVPPDAVHALSARTTGAASGAVEVSVPAGEVRIVELVVAATDSAPAHPTNAPTRRATVTGTVRTPNGHAVAGATVLIDGAAATTTTSDSGAFAIGGVPGGSRMLEVRAIGFLPKRVAIAPDLTTSTSVAVVLDSRVTQLSGVTVLGQPTRRTGDLAEFDQRRAAGMGQFITRAQIDSMHTVNVCDVLRHITAAQVQSVAGSDCLVKMRSFGVGPCPPNVYVDGVKMGGATGKRGGPPEGSVNLNELLGPGEIEGIEIYRGAAPGRFRGGTCGAILVWTRRG